MAQYISSVFWVAIIFTLISGGINSNLNDMTTMGFVSGAGIINTFAGTSFGVDGVLSTLTSLSIPSGLTHESVDGEYFISESSNNLVWKVFRNSTMVRYAGSGYLGYNGDGKLARETDFSNPTGLAAFNSELFISDTDNGLVRKVDKNGFVSTVAGSTSIASFSDNVPANQTSLNFPSGIYVNSLGELFIAESGNHRIRKVFTNGTITTVVGDGQSGYNGDNMPATNSSLKTPKSIDFDSEGNMYIADYGNHRIRKVFASNGTIITFAGNGTLGFSGDGLDATLSQISYPIAVTLGRNGELYIVEETSSRIRMVSPSGIISTFSGTGANGFVGDNSLATNASLGLPTDAKLSRSGELNKKNTSQWHNNNDCYDRFNGDGLLAKETILNSPVYVTVHPDKSIIIVEKDNQRVRKIDPNGIVSTIVGTGKKGYNGDILALDASLNNPMSVAIDSNGNLILSESSRIRILLSNGTLLTIAGSGTNGDGPALLAKLLIPNGIDVMSDGSILIADRYNHKVRKLLTNGSIITIAGTGIASKGVDGIIATNSSLNHPSGVYAMPDGDILICERNNHRIRRVFSSNYTIITIAGTGTFGYNGEGLLATDSTLNYPQSVTMYQGEIYITDTGNSRIRKILQNGTLVTVVGSGERGDSLDGVDLLNSRLKSPYNVAFDSEGRMLIADTLNYKIKMVEFNPQIINTTVYDNSTSLNNTSNSTFTNSSLTNNTNNNISNTTYTSINSTNAIFSHKNEINCTMTENNNSPIPIYDKIQTFAGEGLEKTNALKATIRPYRITTPDINSEFYIAEPSNNRVLKMLSNGTLVTIAGTGMLGYNGDNQPANETQLASPYDVKVYNQELYIADTYNHRIRKVKKDGTIIIVAGLGTMGFNSDNIPATESFLNFPYGIAFDSQGSMYIADSGNYRIRKVLTNGTIITIAGNGVQAVGNDNIPAIHSSLYSPHSVDVDNEGNVFIAEKNSNRIRKIFVNNQTIITIAGNGTCGYYGDNIKASEATLCSPRGVSVGLHGELYIAASLDSRVRMISISGMISTLVGSSKVGFSGDGQSAVNCSLNSPSDVKISSTGDLFVVDSGNYRIRRVSASDGIISTIVGNGYARYNIETLIAKESILFNPTGVHVHSDQTVYIVDRGNQRIRKVDPNTGLTTTIIGNGESGFNGDGPALSTKIAEPEGIDVDCQGNVYFSDSNNHIIRKIYTDGTVVTIAGFYGSKISAGFNGDGPSLITKLKFPYGLQVVKDGSIVFADSMNHRVRRLLTNGTIITIAGNGNSTFSGDGYLATTASLNYPYGVYSTEDGEYLIADKANHRIRKVFANGTITTIAGTGQYGYNGDNMIATQAKLYNPQKVTMFAGEIYIVDTSNNRIRKITANNIIVTVVGNGELGDIVNVDPKKARIQNPYDISFDSNGRMFIADYLSHKIKVVDLKYVPLVNNSTLNNSTIGNNHTFNDNSTLPQNNSSLDNSTIGNNNNTLLQNNSSLANSTISNNNTVNENTTIGNNHTFNDNNTLPQNNSILENSTVSNNHTVNINTSTIVNSTIVSNSTHSTNSSVIVPSNSSVVTPSQSSYPFTNKSVYIYNSTVISKAPSYVHNLISIFMVVFSCLMVSLC